MTTRVQVHYTPANDTVTLILPKFNDISLSILEAHQLILSLVDAVPCKGRAPWPDMPPGVATKLGNLAHIGYVQRRAAEGMCNECGRIKPKPGCVTCVPCLAASNESTVARKKGRVRAGLCVRCPDKAARGHLMCQKHLDYCVARQKLYRGRKLLSGICTQCAQPAIPGRVMCAFHRDYHRDRQRAKIGTKP